MKYKGYDFIGLIGAGLSAYGIIQNNENTLLLAGWIAALLLWIGHIIDSVISYKVHCKREIEIKDLNQKNEELQQRIVTLQVELNTSKRTIENQQYVITDFFKNNQPNQPQQAIPRQIKQE